MQFRPSKWFLYSPVAILPWLAAVVVGGNSVPDDLARRASAALKSAGAEWVALAVDGRDVQLTGDAASAEAIDQAVQAVAGTYGVRRVASAARVVEPPPLAELVAPTVNTISAEAGALVATGTWQEGVATSLKATLAEKTWTLGSDPAFISDGNGNWTLKPELDLAPGTYDLVIEAADATGRSIKDASKDEITIQAPPPPPPPEMKAPTVESVESNSPTPEIRGTWPSTVAKTLTVTLGPTAYELGKSAELTSQAGNWRLVPSVPLADGSLDVSVEVSDGAGRVVKSAVPGRVVVDTKAPDLPVFSPVKIDKQPFTVSGTWPEGDAVSLVARLAGKVWNLGTEKAITSDGKGNWSFTPDVTLEPGTYDLDIEIKDRLGNVSHDATKDEIVIAAPPPPPPPPPEMKEPTVAAAIELVARPVIRGTWSEAAATTLTVSVADASYVLGTDEVLTSDGIGNWSLAVPKPLKDGVYDVAAVSTGAAGKIAKDQSSNELTVDAAGPATPSIALYAGEASPSAITGRWDEANAVGLEVGLPATGISAILGKDSALTSTSGAWSLALSEPLKAGSYDVVVETADSHGRIAADQTKFEILIKEPPPPPPPELKLPAIATYGGEASPKAITGTWDEGNATALSVAIPGAGIYSVLGADAALTSDGKGNWELGLSKQLAPGVYDVVVATSAPGGRTANDATTAEIYVKAPPPPPPPPPPPELKTPAIATYSGEVSPKAISGTWDEGNATALTVAIPGAKITATLGEGAALTSDGNGNWALTVAQDLAPGIYDVSVLSSAADGRSASDATTAEIYIKAPPPPPPPPPYNCEGVLAKIGNTFPIRFDFNKTGINSPYDLSINQVAALLNDPRCLDVKIEITGHADYLGGRQYNMALSLLRAQKVVDLLVASGIDAARLSVTGMGKSAPLDPGRNRTARAKNRRVVITVVK